MTPRTNAECFRINTESKHPFDDLARFCRKIETELSAANRQIENLKIKSAIARTDVEIRRVENVLAQMRSKQTSRHRELARQEAIARCSNTESSHAGTGR